MSREELHQEWRGRLQEQGSSGLSQRQWCFENNVSLHRFGYWRQRLRQAGEALGPTTTWCPLTVLSEPSAGITIRIGAAAIEVKSGFDAGLLRAVARALGDTPC